MPVASYKTFYDGSGAVTGAVWLASENDASKLVGADAVNVGYAAGPRPMYGAAIDRVLELDTGVGSLTRRISDNGLDCCDGPVYIDMLTQFVPFEEPPVITDSSTKFAVYLNTQSNLVVYHGDTAATASVTDVTLDPASWYRLSIRADVMFSVPCGRVYIDGSLVTSSAAYFPDGTGPGPGGFLFPLASEETSIQAVSFAGNGRIDEFRVFDNDLIFYSPLLLSFDDTNLDVLFAGQALLPGDMVDNGAEISILAADWYAISVTGDCPCVAYSGPVGGRVSSSTGVVTAGHPATVEISASLYTNVTLGTNVVEVPLLASWARANHKTADDVETYGNDWLDDYLLNVAPETDAEIMISAISYDAAAGVAAITVSASSSDVRFDRLNGVLAVYTCAELGAGWGEPIGEYRVGVEGAGEASLIVNCAAGSFIKAVIK